MYVSVRIVNLLLVLYCSSRQWSKKTQSNKYNARVSIL